MRATVSAPVFWVWVLPAGASGAVRFLADDDDDDDDGAVLGLGLVRSSSKKRAAVQYVSLLDRRPRVLVILRIHEFRVRTGAHVDGCAAWRPLSRRPCPRIAGIRCGSYWASAAFS